MIDEEELKKDYPDIDTSNATLVSDKVPEDMQKLGFTVYNKFEEIVKPPQGFK